MVAQHVMSYVTESSTLILIGYGSKNNGGTDQSEVKAEGWFISTVVEKQAWVVVGSNPGHLS